MKKLGGQRAEGFVRAYNKATATELWEVYKSGYSAEKATALKEIKSRDDHDGLVYILSHNTFNYSTGYINREGKLVVDTACNTYVIDKSLVEV